MKIFYCIQCKKKLNNDYCYGKNKKNKTYKCGACCRIGRIPWNRGKELHYAVWNKGYVGYMSGKKHWNWRGGKSKGKNGYIFLSAPHHPHSDKKGRIYEHRFVMEKHLGRYLNSEEIVHHINKNPFDNRLENLIVMGRGKHQSMHRIDYLQRQASRD